MFVLGAQETAEACSIRAMPTFKFFKKGQEIGELVGANPGKLKAMIEQHKTPIDVWNTTGGHVLGGGGKPSEYVPPSMGGQLTGIAARLAQGGAGAGAGAGAGTPPPQPTQPAQPPQPSFPTTGGRRLNDPTPPAPQQPSGDDAAKAAFGQQVVEMGFTAGQAERAYAATKGRLDAAVDWCLSHPDDGSGKALGGSAAPPPQRGDVPAGIAGAGAGAAAATGGDGGGAARTQEEQDVLEDIYGDDGPPEGGLSASAGAGRTSKFPPELRIVEGMSVDEQRAMYALRLRVTLACALTLLCCVAQS